MKPAEAQSSNLRELDRARQGLTVEQQEMKLYQLVGALSQHTSPEVWDQCLNTTYGYIASCQVKLMTQQGSGYWHAFDGHAYDRDNSPTGSGLTEQKAKDDFWRQWKEKRARENGTIEADPDIDTSGRGNDRYGSLG